ncbi:MULTISPECIES: ABC transporter substrate-binding protein [Metabacillus]|uniref:ABC transporter substrate-binding protein n=1 Tax=Metabacillus hrfriensis TaxID=3048891 RepID=A0ACD4R9N3_9BACI|nr:MULTISPECIES: ABC transporter substrate-binding protein [Metabacillus]UAL51677.1 ABC transporter substrate-binding protein [Metabacillus dongyingensis]USK27985.1 ABC transporter substrate-binding protein [Bacillus sp. CMF21]WHZ57193.1 ABC transporter substrate-binding protein [Metabacillus sp. CT-WN-B3]
MKKRTALLLSSVLSVSLVATACSSSNVTKGGSDDKVVVDVFNIKVETKKQLDELVETYESQNKNVDINVTTVGGGQDAPAALQAKFSSGDEPSIFMMGGLNDAKKWQKTLLDVSETEAAKLAIEGTLGGATIDGVSYGLPYNIEGFGWMVNKEIFKKAGIEVESIQSFADFENAVKTIDSKKKELGIDAVFAFSAKENWVVSQYSSNFMSLAYENDLNAALEAEKPSFEYGNQFNQYTDLMNKYNLQPIVSIDYSTSVEEKFANGKVAIIHQGNWIIPTLDGIDETFSQEKLALVPMFLKDGEPGTVAAGPSWFWGINKNEDEKVVEESKKFLDWVYTSKEGKKSLIEDFKYIPAYKGNDADSIKDPVSKVIYQHLSDGNNTVWIHGSYPNGWFQSGLHPEFQKYLTGDITWDEFTKSASKSWEELRSNE